jgi:hypothetical protein
MPCGLSGDDASSSGRSANRLGVPEDQARNLFLRVNKNEDAWVCQRKLPGDATHFNFIDNQAVGLDRS